MKNKSASTIDRRPWAFQKAIWGIVLLAIVLVWFGIKRRQQPKPDLDTSVANGPAAPVQHAIGAGVGLLAGHEDLALDEFHAQQFGRLRPDDLNKDFHGLKSFMGKCRRADRVA